MSSKLGYRETIKPKNRVAKYRRSQGVHVYCYRENGVEKVKAVKFIKWERNPDYVENNETDKPILQDGN